MLYQFPVPFHYYLAAVVCYRKTKRCQDGQYKAPISLFVKAVAKGESTSSPLNLQCKSNL